MSCLCNNGRGDSSNDTNVPQRTTPYKYLFKYIIVGDTGMLDFLFGVKKLQPRERHGLD